MFISNKPSQEGSDRQQVPVFKRVIRKFELPWMTLSQNYLENRQKSSIVAHVADSQGRSSRTQQYVFQYFTRKLSFKERRQTREEIARQVIDSLTNASFVENWDFFALTQCQDLISRTPHNAIALDTSLDEAIEYLRFCLREQRLFISNFDDFSECQKTYQKVYDALISMRSFLKAEEGEGTDESNTICELPWSNVPTPDAVVEKRAIEWLKEIATKLEREGRAYCPYSYRSGPKNAGHAIAFKVSVCGKDRVLIQRFNIGNGSSSNPTLDYDLYNKTISFSSFPRSISREKFFGQKGIAAFSKLLRYGADLPIDTPYDGNDINDVFEELLFGEDDTEPSLGPQESEFEARQQIVNSCSPEAIINVMNDVLIMEGISKKERQLFFFNKRVYSLINHFVKLDVVSSPSNSLFLLGTAVKALARTAEDFYESSQMGMRDLIRAVAVFRTINHTSRHLSRLSQQELPTVQQLDYYSDEPKKSISRRGSQIEPSFSSKATSIENRSVGRVPFETPFFKNVNELPKKMERWLSTASEMNPDQGFYYICDCFKQLPIPLKEGAEGHDVWNNFDIRATPHTIENILKLVQTAFCRAESDDNSPQFFLEQFMLIHTSLAVVDKLARRLPETKLNGFITPFLPPQWQFSPHGFVSLNFASDNYRYTQLEHYTWGKYQLQEEIYGKFIFPTDNFLNIQKFVHDHLSNTINKDSSQGVHHINYLAQFVKERSKNKLEYYKKNWYHGLPRPCQVIYYLSYLSFFIISGFKDQFPLELDFKSIISNGYDGLVPRCILKMSGTESLSPLYSGWGIFHERKKIEKPIQINEFMNLSFPNRSPEMVSHSGRKNALVRDDLQANSHTDPCLNPFEDEIYNLNSNQIACYRVQENIPFKMPKRSVRMLLSLYNIPSLSFWRAMQEFSLQENLTLFQNESAQEIFDFSIFQPFYLSEELRGLKAEITKKAFRDLIADAIHFFIKSQFLKTLIFLLKEGIAFEGFTNPCPRREGTLQFYQQVLKDLINQNLGRNEQSDLKVLFTFLKNTQGKEVILEEFIDLIKELFHAHIERKAEFTRNWLTNSLKMISRNFVYLNSRLVDAHSNSICNSILSDLFLKNNFLNMQSYHWKGEFPCYSCGEYTINLLNGTLYSEKMQGFLKHLNKVKDEIKKHNPFWVKLDKSAISLDEKWHYCSKRDVWTTAAVNGNNTETSVSNVSSDVETALFKNLFLWLKRSEYKLNTDLKGISTIYQRDSTPYIRIDHQKKIYERLDERGLPSSLAALNLRHLTSTDPLFAYTGRFIDLSHLLCFINKKDGLIEELNFFSLNLQFKRNDRGLESLQVPGAYLIATEMDLSPFRNLQVLRVWEEVKEELGDYQQSFILYQPDRDKWIVILPEYSIESLRGKLQGSYNSSERVFRLDYHSSSQQFKTSVNEIDDAGYAQLAYLFKQQGNFEKGIKYLNRINPLRKNNTLTKLAFQRFISIRDFSIPSIAFNLRLILLLIRMRNAMTEELFRNNQRRGKEFESYFIWGMDLYENYFDPKKFKDLPEYLQITVSDQRILLLAFRNRYYDFYNKTVLDWVEKWSKERPTLDAQFNLLFSKTQSVTIKPPPQTIYLNAPIYASVRSPFYLYFRFNDSWSTTYLERASLPIPRYPVRVPIGTTLANFPSLYRMALDKTQHPHFDEIITALLKEGNSIASQNEVYPPAELLLYVRHFAHLFSSVDPSQVNWSDKNEVSQFFKNLFACFGEIGITKEEEIDLFRKTFLKVKKEKTFKEKVITAKRPLIKLEKFPERESNLSFETVGHLSTHELYRKAQELEQNIYQLFNGHYKKDHLEEAEVLEEALLLLRDIGSSSHREQSKKLFYQRSALPEIIMRKAILKNNLSFFETHRNFLSKKEIQDICRDVCDWYFIHVMINLQKENIVHLFVKYDHQNFPEFSYFYLNAGKFLRSKQMKIYKKLFFSVMEKRNHHFQLPAGDGKTDVMIPLLNLLADRCGLVATTCVTRPMYNVNKNNLSYNLQTLGENLAYLEIKMSLIHLISGHDLEFIFRELNQYRYEGKKLIITRETYASIFLISHLACYMGMIAKHNPVKDTKQMALERGKKIRWSLQIVNFFEEHVLLLWDESHQTKAPKNRFVYGVGDFQPLPQHESDHLFDLMYFYRSTFDDSVCQQEVAKLYRDFKENPSMPFESFQFALAKSYLNLFKEIPTEEREKFLNYWLQPGAPQPDLLKIWAQSADNDKNALADKAALTRYFLSSHFLKDILHLRTDVDHGRSPYKDRRHEVPAQNKVVSSAEYEDRYKGDVLTIKGYYDRGLSFPDFIYLMKKLEELHLLESNKASITPSQKLISHWVKGTSFAGYTLGLSSHENKEMMAGMYPLLSKNKDLISFFVKRISFKESGGPDTQLICTINDFKAARHISFTATPNPEETFPLNYRKGYGGDFTKDNKFESEVLKTFENPKNGRMIFIKDPKDFFKEMIKKDPESFYHHTVILDPRGFFEGLSNLEIAQRWMANNPSLDGVVYCDDTKDYIDPTKEASSSENENQNSENEQVRLFFRGKIYQIADGNIPKFFKEKLECDWSQFKLGTYYDPPRTESWHVDQKDNTKALVLFCDGISRYHLIQLLMRLRGFTDPSRNQTVTQVYAQTTAQRVFGLNPPSSTITVRWCADFTSDLDRKNIILNAFTSIRSIISEHALLELKRASQTDQTLEMLSVVNIFERYHRGLTDKIHYEAYVTHGSHEILRQTRIVLEEYATRTYAKFGYSIPLHEDKPLLDRINEVITSTENEVKEIYSNDAVATTKSIEHHLEIKTQIEREQEDYSERNVEATPIDPKYVHDLRRIDRPVYLNIPRILAQDFSPFLTDKTYFTSNYIRTAKLLDSEDEAQFLKPVHFIVILIYDEDGTKKVCAIFDSPEIYKQNRIDLKKCLPKISGLKHQAFLVDGYGHLVEVGTGALTPDQQIVSGFFTSKWYQSLKMDMELLKGRITDPEALFKRIQEYDVKVSSEGKSGWVIFEELWEKIRYKMINPNDMQDLEFEALKSRWYGQYPSTPKAHPSLLLSKRTKKDTDEKKDVMEIKDIQSFLDLFESKYQQYATEEQKEQFSRIKNMFAITTKK